MEARRNKEKCVSRAHTVGDLQFLFANTGKSDSIEQLSSYIAIMISCSCTPTSTCPNCIHHLTPHQIHMSRAINFKPYVSVLFSICLLYLLLIQLSFTYASPMSKRVSDSMTVDIAEDSAAKRRHLADELSTKMEEIAPLFYEFLAEYNMPLDPVQANARLGDLERHPLDDLRHYGVISMQHVQNCIGLVVAPNPAPLPLERARDFFVAQSALNHLPGSVDGCKCAFCTMDDEPARASIDDDGSVHGSVQGCNCGGCRKPGGPAHAIPEECILENEFRPCTSIYERCAFCKETIFAKTVQCKCCLRPFHSRCAHDLDFSSDEDPFVMAEEPPADKVMEAHKAFDVSLIEMAETGAINPVAYPFLIGKPTSIRRLRGRTIYCY